MYLYNSMGKNFKLFVLNWLLLSSCTGFFCTGCTDEMAPPIDNSDSMPQALMSVDSTGLSISSRMIDSPSIVAVKTRTFKSEEAFIKFAEKNLGAKRVYDDEGRTVAVKGEYVRSGDILFRDAKGGLFKQYDFIAAYLGGSDGKFQIGDKEISLYSADLDSSTIYFNNMDENCVGDDCVAGEVWLTHRIFYHSFGGKTKQTSGGLRTVSSFCCLGGGQLGFFDGVRKCRYRNPGAWECSYNRDAGRVICVPKTGDKDQLYRYTGPATCTSQALNNRLRLNLKLVFGPNNTLSFEKTAANTRELEICQWSISIGIELDPDYIDDIIGICGYHASTSGGSVRTSEGWTGDDDILCID